MFGDGNRRARLPFLVSTESGFAALELANDLAAEEGVVHAVPDRLLGALEE